MSDRFHPVSMEQLCSWVFTELEENDSLLGIPRELVFTPQPSDRFTLQVYGQRLESPFGVAAGPHTQMAQNILAAWLCGARFIELKTVQTLDELDINKPCIDIQDEGYNVEWSQELRIFESFDEYLRAWVLLHALHHRFGFPDDAPGVVFNMSVGYNLEGILKPNVQWFLDTMDDASDYLPGYVDIVAQHMPEVRDLDIPARLSDNVTLSTMHGCPPDEIERITEYLIAERGLHTSVKCNPTLLGAERVRRILHDDLGYVDVPVPDEAFGHDLMYEDAVPMFHNLNRLAAREGVDFGLKLTNTLEVGNWRRVFPDDTTMYLSGRALHAITTNLASTLAEEYSGDLLLSFAGGADCFNVPDLLRSGMTTVTVCSDLLKSGGYLRMLQYFETLEAAMGEAGAHDLPDFVAKTAPKQPNFKNLAALLRDDFADHIGLGLDDVQIDALIAAVSSAGEASAVEVIAGWADDRGFDADLLTDRVLRALARINLRQYAKQARSDPHLHKQAFDTAHSKTTRQLDLFDCIEAPCVDECPVDQAVPQYMEAVRTGDYAAAVAITRGDNPIPAILGHVCDHLCEHTCIRTHYDEPLAIREIKRFIMAQEVGPNPAVAAANRRDPVAVIGAGPAGLAASERLASAGHRVTVFEMHRYAGGMVGGAIPTYRLPQAVIDQDLAPLERLGVEFRFEMKAGEDFTLDGLRRDGYAAIVVAVGAQLAKRLGLEGEEADGVVDGIDFLRSVREGNPMGIGRRVAVIGAGDTAMDCARTAWRLGSEVTVVYRRTIDQMPADREEVRQLLQEGIRVEELAKPTELIVEDGKLTGLVCARMEYRGDRDAGGRKVPHEVPDSHFELPFDTMLLAVSQHSVLGFFGDEQPELTERGYLKTDPETLETSVPGVYAGGDVGTHGPASIVEAAGDGKRIAASIIGRLAPEPEPHRAPEDWSGLLRRRAHREFRVPVRQLPLEERTGFQETVLTYSEEEAKAEAGRCLDCHTVCSICVGVCPNLAILTYGTEPLRVHLPTLTPDGSGLAAGDSVSYRVDQQLQVAVLTDFCNECGNCATFCPTAGEPYRDKPRLYLDRADFEAQDDNAFMMFRDGGIWSMEARIGGETHRVDLNGDLTYTSPTATVRLDPASWEVMEATAADGDDREVSLKGAADMYVLLTGLRDSAPHLPAATSQPGSRVSHPGYTEG